MRVGSHSYNKILDSIVYPLLTLFLIHESPVPEMPTK